MPAHHLRLAGVVLSDLSVEVAYHYGNVLSMGSCLGHSGVVLRTHAYPLRHCHL